MLPSIRQLIELIPGKVRGTVDLVVNATFWLGAIVGSLASLLLLDGNIAPVNVGWRIAFGIGAILGGAVLVLRLSVPESPRWLMLRRKEDDANKIVAKSRRRYPRRRASSPPRKAKS